MTVRLLRAVALGLIVALGLLWWLLPHGIATLLKTTGKVERDEQRAEGRFRPAMPGATFEVGDGLRTSAMSTAEVSFRDGPRLRVGAATLVRFRADRAGARRMTIAGGEVRIDTAEEPVLLETAAGLVRVAAHSRATLRDDPRHTRVELVLGRAELEWTSERAPRALAAGESATAPHPVSEAAAEDVPDAAAAVVGDDAAVVVAPASDAAAVLAPPKPRADDALPPTPSDQTLDLALTASPRLTIFDATPPTGLRIAPPRPCATEPSLEIARSGRFVGATSPHAFEVGNTKYRLRCGGRVVASGSVRVVRDAGQRALGKAAPSNVFDADGRTYTVLYQTRPPELTIRWPSAAPSSSATLVVEGEGGRQRFPVRGAQLTLPSGTLGDGVHKLWFQREDVDLRSRTTTLEIAFDNATPVAQLNEPAVVVPSDGIVVLSGVVVPGARVSVRGEPVALEPSGRFRAALRPRAGERAVAVKVELPGRSVVYFVRRIGAVD